VTVDGLLLIDKPAGMTSHDVVGRVRRIARTRKVGHTGTLDPDATGLLPITIGKCTKLAKYLILDDKEYLFGVELGSATDTDDASGQVIETAPWDGVTEEAMRAALEGFRGEIMQRPPRYSAIKVDGRRAYDLAREGVEFELPERPVRVDELELTEVALPRASGRMACGSGTYVRSLVRDLGEALGTRAHTTSIRRTRVGRFGIEEAVTLDALDAGDVALADALLPPARMLVSLASWTADAHAISEFSFGRRVFAEGLDAELDAHVAVVDEAGDLIAVALVEEVGDGVVKLKPSRVMI
jgi:tRNA pseudouridine55 synthase